MITTERVIAGYKASGLKPVTGCFTRIELDGTKCGCAVTAILVGEGHATFDELNSADVSITETAERTIGLSNLDAWRLIDGFDALDFDSINGRVHELVKVGFEARTKIFEEGVLNNDNS